MQDKLETIYRERFFTHFKINNQTGLLRGHGVKFPTFPYIGSRYGQLKKLLIVGLDIGSDEVPGEIQSFEDRRKAIECKAVSKHNPHIAGTYITALNFLKSELQEWYDFWNKLDGSFTCQKLLRESADLPDTNPLSFIALTNYYKFVRERREHKTGPENRKYLDREFEQEFVVDEIRVFEPDIVVFQSRQFNSSRYGTLLKHLSATSEMYIGPHPSARGHIRRSRILINQIREGALR